MKKLFLTVFVALSMFACTKDQEKDVTITNTSNTSQVENDLIRYANADENVIDYKTAKYLTYLELEKGAKDFLNLGDSYELSNIPRIIYDYDNLPKYYEFDVLVNNSLKYTITSHAKKEDTSVIAFMFEYNKQSVKNNLDAFVGEYPNVIYGTKGDIHSTPINLLTEGTNVTFEECVYTRSNTDNWDNYYNLSENIPEEEKILMLNAINEMKNATEYLELVEKEKEIDNFWNETENISNELSKMESDKIDLNFVISKNSKETRGGTGPGYDGITGFPTTYYIIPEFNNEAIKRTRWTGYCGPAAVAWVYRNLYSHYPKDNTSNNSYIRVHGDAETTNSYDVFEDYTSYGYFDYGSISNEELASIYKETANNHSQQTDNGFYQKLLSHTVKTGNAYPMYQLGMTNAIKGITDKEYSLGTTSTSRSYIENKKLPVFIMIGTGDNFHYLVAFGVGKIDNTNYIYVTDNGSYIGSYNYYPYWRKEGSNYGIRYKLTKK